MSNTALYLTSSVATMDASNEGYGLFEKAAILVEDGRIKAVIQGQDDIRSLRESVETVHDFSQSLLTPGLIDAHTHLVYAGDRSKEFEQRLNGVSYADIQRNGGGILSTVRATRAASEGELLRLSKERLALLKMEGVTTVEIKSGYGLDLTTERKMLRVARALADEEVAVVTTFLGAHAVPEEYAGNPDAYIDLICNEMMPQIADEGLADAVDGFCETIGFSRKQIERVFEQATNLRLATKLHAEQLSDSDGAALAARYQALSADHLEYVSDSGIAAMATAGSVAVLLPGAFYALRETQLPPIAKFRQHAVPIAIATDHNPGTSPILSLQLMMHMACTLFRMTPVEALAGVTCHAAKALGMQHELGSIEVGKRADFAIWSVQHPTELSYLFANRCQAVVKNGALFNRSVV